MPLAHRLSPKRSATWMALRRALAALAAVGLLLPAGFAAAATPPETLARQAYMVDLTTGTVLMDKNGDERMAPSSMTKMMTAYLVYESLTKGQITLDTMLPVSKTAWQMGGSRMFLKLGSSVRVEDLLRGLLIDSGNDAAVALAEGLAGSQSAFADRMNAKAAQLGMRNTHFMNASGWPDPDHYTTAHDLAILAGRMLRDFPQYYHYEAEKSFTWNGIKQGNRNPLLYHPVNIDGIKTGHTEAGGYGLTASGERNGRRLLLVVNGLPSMQSRNDEPLRLLDWGWTAFRVYPLLRKDDTVDSVPVWMGAADAVPVAVDHDLSVTMEPLDRGSLRVVETLSEPLPAPIHRGQVVGQVVVTSAAGKQQADLIATADVPEAGTFTALGKKLSMLLH